MVKHELTAQYTPDGYAIAFRQLIETHRPKYVIFPHTYQVRDFAPKFDKLVAAGKLTSWGWAEQIVGGKYRRLSRMSAPTVESLIAAREQMVLDKAVSAICQSHQDYIWDVKDHGS